MTSGHLLLACVLLVNAALTRGLKVLAKMTPYLNLGIPALVAKTPRTGAAARSGPPVTRTFRHFTGTSQGHRVEGPPVQSQAPSYCPLAALGLWAGFNSRRSRCIDASEPGAVPELEHVLIQLTRGVVRF